MCEVEIIPDGGPWYRDSLNRLSINFIHESFGEMSSVESAVQSSREQRCSSAL